MQVLLRMKRQPGAKKRNATAASTGGAAAAPSKVASAAPAVALAGEARAPAPEAAGHRHGAPQLAETDSGGAGGERAGSGRGRREPEAKGPAAKGPVVKAADELTADDIAYVLLPRESAYGLPAQDDVGGVQETSAGKTAPAPAWKPASARKIRDFTVAVLQVLLALLIIPLVIAGALAMLVREGIGREKELNTQDPEAFYRLCIEPKALLHGAERTREPQQR